MALGSKNGLSQSAMTTNRPSRHRWVELGAHRDFELVAEEPASLARISRRSWSRDLAAPCAEDSLPCRADESPSPALAAAVISSPRWFRTSSTLSSRGDAANAGPRQASPRTLNTTTRFG